MSREERPDSPSLEGASGRADELLCRARRLIDEGEASAALRLLEEALSLAPDSADLYGELGRALNNLRRLPEARDALRDATRLAPDCAVAWNRLGHVSRALGDLDSAESAFRRAVDLDTTSASAMANLASARLARGDPESGIAMLRQAARLDPANPGPMAQLGDALQGLGRHGEADKAYRTALETEATHVPALAGLGALSMARGEYAAAEQCLRKAIAGRPGDPVAMASLVQLLELQGRSEELLALLDEAPWQHPPAWATVAAGRQLLRLGRRGEAAECLERSDPSDMDRRTRSAFLNLKGRLLDAEGEYDAAFQMFLAANRACPGEFDESGFVDTVDRLVRFFSRTRIDSLPGSGCESDRPVFIVGMPRSGSSLVEQILSGHSRVHACGERTDLYALPRRLSGGNPAERWPECLAEVNPGELAQAARDYLEQEGSSSDDGLRVTDKLPANFLNLGLIALLFPRARVIYCRREPMDVGLSCFQQDFQSPGMSFARDLAHIALYSQGCRRLMEHWKQVLDLPILTLDYEKLVADVEGKAQEVVAFLGLAWESQCLRFHASDRVVRTASHDQVRKPVYGTSIGRWKKYERWLGPLRNGLDAPWPGRTDPSGR
jgi:Flp pilus assembly protein TadD